MRIRFCDFLHFKNTYIIWVSYINLTSLASLVQKFLKSLGAFELLKLK